MLFVKGGIRVKNSLMALILGMMLLFPADGLAAQRFLNTEGGMYVCNCNESISLRAYPSTEAEALTQIPLGAVVQEIGGGNKVFAHVSYGGLTGYALYSYLTTYSWVYRVAYCNEYISLRNAPSTDADVLRRVPLGAHVRFVKDAGNGFYYVYYNGSLGYVLNSYLE